MRFMGYWCKLHCRNRPHCNDVQWECQPCLYCSAWSIGEYFPRESS